MGQRLNIIVVAEGAIDRDGKAITPDYVREVSDFLWKESSNKLSNLFLVRIMNLSLNFAYMLQNLEEQKC